MAMSTTLLLVGVACVVVQSYAREAGLHWFFYLVWFPVALGRLEFLYGVVAPVFSPLQSRLSVSLYVSLVSGEAIFSVMLI